MLKFESFYVSWGHKNTGMILKFNDFPCSTFFYLTGLRHEFVLDPSSVEMPKSLHHHSYVSLVQRVVFVVHSERLAGTVFDVLKDLEKNKLIVDDFLRFNI